MGNLEKEIKLKITLNDIEKIKEKTTLIQDKKRFMDITCGKYGFDSLNKLGYICRIRIKDDKSKIEIKRYLNNNECIEKSLKIDSIKDTLEFLSLLDMKPYLILDRFREIRKYNDLILCIDEFDSIGTYLEIEYQESNYDKVLEFAEEFNLDLIPQDKYGDIFKHKIDTSIEFKEEFENTLKKNLKLD